MSNNPMISRNSIELEELIRKNNMFYEPLPEKLVERKPGYENSKIVRAILFKTYIFEWSVLKLDPGTKIKKHPHNGEHELYYIVNDDRVESCLSGSEHDFENTTNEVVKIISLKVTKGFEF